MTKRLGVAVVVLAVWAWAAPASAFIIFSETFDGPGLPSTATYDPNPQIIWSVNGSQQLLADFTGVGSPTVRALTIQGFTHPDLPVVYSLDVGIPAGASAGAYNVGMAFGGYQVEFHPGHSGGAFRIVGGFTSGNQNMGFTPAKGVLHHVEAETRVVLAGLQVDVLIRGLGTDALMHTYNFSFLDTSPNLGLGQFGGRRSGPGPNALNDALFDNYQVDILPEPTSMALLSIGALGLITRRRRQRAA